MNTKMIPAAPAKMFGGPRVGEFKIPDVAQELRQVGLGKINPKSGDVSMIRRLASCPFATVPVNEFLKWTASLPVSDENIKSTFGDSIDLIGNGMSVAGVVSVDSSFVVNGILQTDMLCYGVGVFVYSEPFSGVAQGNAIPVEVTTPMVSPDVFTANDLANGCLGTFPEGTSPKPASLELGFPAWEAAWQMAQGYRLDWRFMQRYYLLQEMLSDVCHFGPFAECVGAGTSEIENQQYVKLVNDQYASMGSPYRFQPITHRRLGSVGAGTQQSPNTGVFRPTNDFKYTTVTHGGLRNQERGRVGDPFRRFPRPILLKSGKPIGLKLQAVNAYHQAQMQRYISISEGLGGTAADIPIASNMSTVFTPTGTDIAEEQTLEASPSLVSQSINTDDVLFKYGSWKIAILLKGTELWGEWTKFIEENAGSGDIYVPGFAQSPADSGTMPATSGPQ